MILMCLLPSAPLEEVQGLSAVCNILHQHMAVAIVHPYAIFKFRGDEARNESVAVLESVAFEQRHPYTYIHRFHIVFTSQFDREYHGKDGRRIHTSVADSAQA
jgi:hypothetical protein